MTATHAHAGIAAYRFTMTEDVRSYDQAREVFDRLYMETTTATMTTDRVKLRAGQSRYGYKIGPKMYLFDGDGFYEVVLYDTPIIRYYADGTLSVDNGGHATPTTRERLDAVLPDGFRAYHHTVVKGQSRLGLNTPGSTFPTRAKVQREDVLWPLDHSVRIDTTTGRKVSR